MDMGRSMELWLSAKNVMGAARGGMTLIAFLGFVLSSGPGYAGPLEQDLTAISQAGEMQGRPPEEMQRLTGQVQRAQSLGLPTDSLVDKIKEGMTKGVAIPRIEQRLVLMITHMKVADTLLQETVGGKGQAAQGGKDRALSVLSEALARGVTPDEVRAVHRDIGETKREIRPDDLAYAAKGMALMKEGGLPPEHFRALTATALRQGIESARILDLAREIKGLPPETRENPARIRNIQTAMEQGQRVEKIISDLQQAQPQFADRPRVLDRLHATERPDRFERPVLPDRPPRVERPAVAGGGLEGFKSGAIGGK